MRNNSTEGIVLVNEIINKGWLAKARRVAEGIQVMNALPELQKRQMADLGIRAMCDLLDDGDCPRDGEFPDSCSCLDPDGEWDVYAACAYNTLWKLIAVGDNQKPEVSISEGVDETG